MEKVDVLVATMKQKDMSLISKMRIESNAVIANQAENFDYKEIRKDFGKIKMITTNTKGVGINRNIALDYSESEYLLIADDDEVLYAEYEKNIVKAFHEVPKADILIFNINTISDVKENTNRRMNERVNRVHFYNVFNYGAVRIAIRKSSLLRANVCFSNLFGGGTPYSAGEDSLFLKKCLFSGLKIFTYPLLIADVYQFESSWFNGYDQKYFFDKGSWAAATFPKMKFIMCILFTIKTYEKCEISLIKALKLSLAGCRGFHKNLVFDSWKKGNTKI